MYMSKGYAMPKIHEKGNADTSRPSSSKRSTKRQATSYRYRSGRLSAKQTGASKGIPPEKKSRRNFYLTIGDERWYVKFVPYIKDVVRPLYPKSHPFQKGDFYGMVDVPRWRILIATEGLTDRQIDAALFHEMTHVANLNLSERSVRRLERRLFPALWERGLRFS